MATADNSGGAFLRELKRRKVVRTCAYYLIVCVVVLLVANILFPAVGLDADQVSRLLLYASILGFPLVFLFAWYFQLTPRGIVRTTNFVERRVLRNMAPINDQRHSGEGDDVRGNGGDKNYSWIISAETGPLTGLSYGVDRPVVLGRSLDCDIAVVSPHVSRQHARLELEDGRLVVEDLDSANGTVVNGRPIQGRHALRHEDELRLHDVIFRVTESTSGSRGELESTQHTSGESNDKRDDAPEGSPPKDPPGR